MSLARSYRVLTLGCKLNQFDSASIEGQLRRRGFALAAQDAPAGVFVVNTCTVTENADREARRLVRRARRENPGCRLIVTGCYAELDRERLAAMEEVDTVIGHSDRHRLPEILDAIAARAEPEGEIACIEAAGDGAALHFGDRTRALLKIQEGCDLACSYCIIPKVRGRSRSVPTGDVACVLEALVRRGFREIVLTGVNAGDYGKDLVPRTDLVALVRRLLATPGLGRLRLGSLEPRTVTSGIVELLSAEPRLAKHLQVPLQSGSDAVLSRMRRNYRTADYRRVLETLREAAPTIGLGADVIVGFPGESDEEFEETCRFVESSPLNYLHVFSYSDRPGTPASAMGDPVARGKVGERSARLRAIGDDLGTAFRRSFVGRRLTVLVLGERRADGRLRALSDNFIDLGIEGRDEDMNTFVEAEVLRADAHGAIARRVRAAADLPAAQA